MYKKKSIYILFRSSEFIQITNVQIFIWKNNYVREMAIVLTIILILIRVFLVNEMVLFQRI